MAKSQRPFESVHIWNINGNQWPARFLVCLLLERCHCSWTQWMLDELRLNSLTHGTPLLAALFKVWPKPELRAGLGSVMRSSSSGLRLGYGRGQGWAQNCTTIPRRVFWEQSHVSCYPGMTQPWAGPMFFLSSTIILWGWPVLSKLFIPPIKHRFPAQSDPLSRSCMLSVPFF